MIVRTRLCGAPRALAALVFAVFAAIVVQACTTGRPASICPAIAVFDRAATVTKFTTGADGDISQMTYHGQIAKADLDCIYKSGSLNDMEATIRVDMSFVKGPAAKSDNVAMEYFVVITDRRGQVVDKKIFPVKAGFGGKREVVLREEIWQLYELESGAAGASYEIWIGFQLTDQELKFNRKTGL